MIPTLIQVALGGAIGSTLRYLAGLGAVRLMGHGFPWGTLFVNVTGSFVIGALAVVLAHRGGTQFAPFLVTGVLGGYTTFSAFSLDTLTLWERGEPGLALAYIAASVAVSLAAIVAGLSLARALA